jgi:uncharacterized membrane protein YuzA (DUF378 family)
MVSLDYTSIRARTYPTPTISSQFAGVLERLFLAWITAIAALVFLFSLVLAVFQVISLMQLFYVYVGIAGITLALAGALYCARRAL